jgi:protein-disulfide isomerase
LSRKVIIAVVAAAVVVVGVLIGVQVASNNSDNSASHYQSLFTADWPNVDKLLSGIPESGQTLGSATAPVKITEYMDYKCPVCGAASGSVVPQVITKYVRPGIASIQLRPVQVIDSQSVDAGVAGLATAPQNLMWPYTELILRNQGKETTQWLTPAVQTNAATTAGIHVPPWQAAQKQQSTAVQFETDVQNFQADTSAAGLNPGTPTFIIVGPKKTVAIQGDVPLSSFDQAFAQVGAPTKA